MAGSIFRRFLIFCAGLSLATASACAPSRPAPPASDARTITDDIGRSVAIAARPQRIISLAPNLTEIVFALGAGDRLIADTSYCNFPAEAKDKVHVGDTLRPDVERIVSLKPDLVLVSTASQLEGASSRLERLGIPVYVSNPRDLDGILASIEKLGDVIGEPEAGRRAAASLRERLSAVATRIEGRPPVKVFLVVSPEPLITSGKGTFVDDAIRRAGGASISGDEATEWPQYSAETVIARAPEAIVVSTMTDVVPNGNGVPDVLDQTPAVRNKRVVMVDADLLMRPGPRLVDGIETLARALHQEAFR